MDFNKIFENKSIMKIHFLNLQSKPYLTLSGSNLFSYCDSISALVQSKIKYGYICLDKFYSACQELSTQVQQVSN